MSQAESAQRALSAIFYYAGLTQFETERCPALTRGLITLLTDVENTKCRAPQPRKSRE